VGVELYQWTMTIRPQESLTYYFLDGRFQTVKQSNSFVASSYNYVIDYFKHRGISGEDGPPSDKELPRSLFPGHFQMKTFCIAFHKSYLSTTCRSDANNSLMC
jgi:hypothetical protein